MRHRHKWFKSLLEIERFANTAQPLHSSRIECVRTDQRKRIRKGDEKRSKRKGLPVNHEKPMVGRLKRPPKESAVTLTSYEKAVRRSELSPRRTSAPCANTKGEALHGDGINEWKNDVTFNLRHLQMKMISTGRFQSSRCGSGCWEARTS